MSWKLTGKRSCYTTSGERRNKLRQLLEIKERELKELGRAVKEKEGQKVGIKRGLQEEKTLAAETKLKNMLLEEMGIKLKTCKGISELVSKLLNLTCQAERDEVTKEV